MTKPSTLSSASSDITGRRLSRLIWVFVLIVAVVAMSTAALPWSFTFSALALSNEAAAQIRQATGLATLSQGRAVFAILPQPHIKIEQISFGDPSGALHIDADYFKGNLRVLPLFVGRLEIASATLLKPRLFIDLDHKFAPEESAIGRAAEAKSDTPEAAAADTARLGVVSLVNGTARIASKSMKTDIIIDNIDMTLDWRNLDTPASLTGKARVQGEFGDIAAWIAEPAELLRGGRSQVTLDVKTDVLSLTTNGIFAMSPKPEFSGHLQSASQNLPKLLDLMGYPIARTSLLGRFRLNCEAKGNGDGMAFSDLNLRLAGSDFEGSLAVDMAGIKPLLSGTLATDLLTLDPFFLHFQPLIEAGQWSKAPLDFRIMALANLDLRISAARARLAHFDMQDAALSVMTHSNRMDLSLAQAKTYRGLIKARATLTMNEDAVDVRAGSSMSDLDIGALSWDVAGMPELTGAASGTGNIETAGRNILELVQHLNGRLQVTGKQGDVRSMDLDQLLHSANSSASAHDANQTAAPISYEKAELLIKIVNGTAAVEQGLADGPSGHLLLSGTTVLPERKFDLRAVILPLVADEPLSAAWQNHNIIIKGPWDHPLFTSAVQ
jgi:AsmA protein